eukprot:2443868-Prymnesium_polylepis.1
MQTEELELTRDAWDAFEVAARLPAEGGERDSLSPHGTRLSRKNGGVGTRNGKRSARARSLRYQRA